MTVASTKQQKKFLKELIEKSKLKITLAEAESIYNLYFKTVKKEFEKLNGAEDYDWVFRLKRIGTFKSKFKTKIGKINLKNKNQENE